MPPELVAFRAFIFAPRDAFADLFDDARDYKTTMLSVPMLTDTFHSVNWPFHIDNCAELKAEWLHMARVMSAEHFKEEVQQQNAIARVIKENLVDQSLGRFADVAVILGEHRFYEQSDRGKRRKCGMVARAASISPNKVAEPLRFLMRRSGGERIDQDCLELMKERQSDIYYVTGFTTIPPMCPEDPLIDQPSMVALEKNGLVVTYTVHLPAGGLCSCFTRSLERQACLAVSL